MRNSKEILRDMKEIDAKNETMRIDIKLNMKDREQLLKEFNKAEELEKQAKSVFIANESGLKKVSKYL